MNYNLFTQFVEIVAFKENLIKLKAELEQVVEDSNLYERVRNGFQVLIFGPPNSGKSSLMNYLGNLNISLF